MSATKPTGLGFLAGVVAGAAAGAVLVLARIVTGTPSLPEIVGEALVGLVPLAVFDLVLDALTFAAKPLFLSAVVVGYLLLSGALGALHDRLSARLRGGFLSRLGLAALLAAGLWLAFGLVLLPILGKGVFGGAGGATLATIGPTVLAAAVYAVVLAVVLALADGVSEAEGAEVPDDAALESRRQLLRALAGGSVLVVVLAGVGRGASLLAANSNTARQPQTPDETLPPDVTPNSAFYVVSKNIASDPVVDASKWLLEISGLVEKPFTLSYDQLRALPPIDQYVTLECISNPIGGDLIGNARWRGVRLADLLGQAGVKPEARKVVFYAADDYQDSIPVDRALSPASLLVYEMNGEKLTTSHGFPLRLLVPGIYGMKNVKWIRRVSLVDYDFKGYWEKSGWTDDATIKTMSRVDRPESSVSVKASVRAGGVAFAGDRGITRVEVSTDEGKTWREALLQPALSPYSWVLWTADLTLEPGFQRIFVRATDGSGSVQVPGDTSPLPDGSSGLHWVAVHVQQG